MYAEPVSAARPTQSPTRRFRLGASRRARRARPALICAVTGRTITYAELRGLVERTAAGLAALGVRKGDVCAVFAPNSPSYVIAVLADRRLGAVATTGRARSTRRTTSRSSSRTRGARGALHRRRRSRRRGAGRSTARASSTSSRSTRRRPTVGGSARSCRSTRWSSQRASRRASRSSRAISSRCRTRAARRACRRA